MTTEATERAAPITNPLLKYDQKKTRSNAIRAKCAECMGCSRQAIEPGFRAMIRECTSYSCPLYDWRPYQRSEADDEGEES